MDLPDRLVDRGNTVIVIEHNLDAKKGGLAHGRGSGCGTAGMEIVFTGMPEKMTERASTITAEYLRKSL